MSGTLMLAWLMWAAGTAPAETPVEVEYMNRLGFKIPLEFKDKSNIQALTLYVSSDQGKSWQQHANCYPDQDSFSFWAPRDGTYWFTVDCTDLQGKHTLTNMDQVPAGRKIVIDTLKPQIRIVSAVRKGENIEVVWEIQEEHPNLGSLRLEYRTADAPAESWTTVPIEPSLNNKASFPLPGTGQVFIRMQMADLAQNLTVAPATEIPAVSAVTPASMASTVSSGPPDFPAVGTGSSQSPYGRTSMKSSAADKEGSGRNDTGLPPLPTDPPPAPTPATETGSRQVVASTSGTGPSAAAESAGPSLPKRTLPPLRVVKDRQVTLEYALKDVGPSGIGKVELWITRDDGQTWDRYAEDPEVKTSQTHAHYQRLVQLPPEDGIYGIHLVVRSRAGLGKPAPKPGDPPQMRIEVDTTAPEAQLYPPAPAAGQRDTLRLSWTASDRNLAPNPITLQWREKADGTWHTIAGQLPNTGQHLWKLPPHLPDRVYLRLVARDTAGNEGIAETREPQLVDLSEPEGVLIGVVQVSGAAP